VTRKPLFRISQWVWIVCLFGVLLAAAGGAAAIQRSVTIQAHWRVLPYQVLQFMNTDDGGTSAVYVTPEPTGLDRERGYIEDEYAFRLRVISNTSWKLQVVDASSSSTPSYIRRHGGEYVALTDDALVIASGANGSYEVGIDVRIKLVDGQPAVPAGSLNLVFTLMSL